MTFLDIIIILGVLVLVGGGIILAILLIKKSKNKKLNGGDIDFSFTTKHGIRVKLSPLLQSLKPADVEVWTENLIQFWHDKKGWNKEIMYKEIGKSFIIMFDEIYIIRDNREVNALTWLPVVPKIEIATLYKPEFDQSVYTPLMKVESLFRHEESHVIVAKMDSTLSLTEGHHALFKEIGLGA